MSSIRSATFCASAAVESEAKPHERSRPAAAAPPSALALAQIGPLHVSAAILLVALALQCVYFTGLVGSDDVHYFHVAEQMRSGVPAPLDGQPVGDVYFSRWVTWGLVRLGTDILPGRIVGLAAPFVLSSLATVVLVIALGRRFISGPMACAPAVLVSLTPAFVNLASVALPEPPAVMLAWLGIALAAGCLLTREVRHAGFRMWLAGLLIAMAYSAKESAAILVPCLLLFLGLYRRRERWAWPRAAWLMGGALCWLVVDAVLLYRWTGDPFFRMHAVRTNLGEFEVRTLPTWEACLTHWSYYLRVLTNLSSEMGLIGPLLLAGMLYGMVRRSDATRLMLCLILPTLIYLSAGSADWRRYVALPQHPRYLLIILPAMALLSGMLFHDLWQRGHKMRILLAVAAVPLILSCVVAPRQWAGRMSVATTVDAARRLIAARPEMHDSGPILTSDYAYYRLAAVPYFAGGPEIRPVREMPQSFDEWIARFPGALVISTRFDRNGPPNAAQAYRTFKGRPLAALTSTTHLAHAEPPLDRLDTIRAWLSGRPEPRNAAAGVDLWKIPAKQVFRVASRDAVGIRGNP